MSRGAPLPPLAGARESDEADLLMRRFAERTGLDPERAPRRYLWTDAFAVCNYLALWRITGAAEPQALEIIRVLQKAGADVNVVALINHPEEIRGGTALHYAVRKRYKTVIKELASFGIDMDAVDQDGLTALDYTQSRGFMPFMALQTPLYKEEAQLLRDLGATKLMARSPVWPVLGPPQGVWEDIWPLGESTVHEPVYKPSITSAP